MYTKRATTISLFIYIANVFMVFGTGTSETIHCLQCKEEECDETNLDTFNMTRTECYQDYYKCATFLGKKNKSPCKSAKNYIAEGSEVIERRCLKSDEEHNCELEFPQCQSCDVDHCNTQNMRKPLCYVCHGEDCVSARNSNILNVVACQDEDAQCISIIFPSDNVNVNSSLKDCLNAKDVNYKNCVEALAKKGFCRICRGHLCNSVENNFNEGDPIAQHQCYHCKGKDCSRANSNLLLDKETCSRYGAQCISVIYPKKHIEKNVKGCFYGKDDPTHNRCVEAFQMGGFCRICNERLCNMLLPQPMKLRCYHCLGNNCTMAKNSTDLDTVQCLKEDSQCISVTFSVNHTNVKKNMKSCSSNFGGRGLDLCANAAAMGGFCRICNSTLCNSVENNFQNGDPLPQPKIINKKSRMLNQERSAERSSKRSSDNGTKHRNLSSRLFVSSPLFTNMLFIFLYVT